MAEIPKRATATEAYLQDRDIAEITIERLKHSLAEDFIPFSDMRASADYRLAAAANMLMQAIQQDNDGHYGLAHHDQEEGGRI